MGAATSVSHKERGSETKSQGFLQAALRPD